MFEKLAGGICFVLLVLSGGLHPALAQDADLNNIMNLTERVCRRELQSSIQISGSGAYEISDRRGQLTSSFRLSRELYNTAFEGMDGATRRLVLGEQSQCMERNFLLLLKTLLVSPAERSRIVLMMDSPANVYRPRPGTNAPPGTTNSDYIAAELRAFHAPGDSRVLFVKEGTGPDWGRSDYVIGLAPYAIMIHYSAFDIDGATETTAGRERFVRYAQDFLRAGIPLVIYSRTPGFCSDASRSAMRRSLGLDTAPAQVRDQVVVVAMSGASGPPRHFTTPSAATDLSTALRSVMQARLNRESSSSRGVITPQIPNASLRTDRVCTLAR